MYILLPQVPAPQVTAFKETLDVDHHRRHRLAQRSDGLDAQLEVSVMGHGNDNGVHVCNISQGRQVKAVMVVDLFRDGNGIVDEDFNTVSRQFRNDINYPGIADIGDVFLEGKAKDGDAGLTDGLVGGDEHLDRPFGDVFSHAIVYPASGQDHFRVVTQAFGLVGKIVRIDADAMASDQSRAEGEKIPLRSCRFKDFEGVYSQALKNDGQLVHEGNVDVPLGIFNDLGRFRHFNGGGFIDSRLDDLSIDSLEELHCVPVGAGDDFNDALQGVDLVAGVDPFR